MAPVIHGSVLASKHEHTPDDGQLALSRGLSRLQLIRRWRTGVCGAGLLSTAAPALYCHNHPVRTLAAGSLETLVSGDSSGVIAVWRV